MKKELDSASQLTDAELVTLTLVQAVPGFASGAT